MTMYVTDGGLETDLIFNRGIDLPEFAAFVLVDDAAGKQALIDYHQDYFEIARANGAGYILGTPTWRANREWGDRLGYDRARLADVNRRWADQIASMRESWGDSVPGDPDDLADGYTRLREKLPNLTVLGGCCGTDHRHVAAVAERLL